MPERSGRRQVSILYRLELSAMMSEQLRLADRAAAESRRMMKRLSGVEQPDRFVRADGDRIRRVRQEERLGISG